MAKQMIADLQVGEPGDSVFLGAESSLRTTRNDNAYLSVKLSDRSGRVEGRLWDAGEALAGSIAVDDFVHVKGRAESFRNEIQINIRTITRADTDKLRLGDFLPQSEHDSKEMFAELKEILERVEDADYRALIDAFLSDEGFVRGFVSAPAAMQNHHAYLGGLLEHTLSMARLALALVEHYGELRQDLLLTGVFLHDAGKVRELACRRSFQFTTSGRLVGHIVLGALMIEEKVCAMKGFPQDKLDMVRHLVLSHHGELAFGAARLPMFAEAMALHHLDNLDAKLKEVAEILEKDANSDDDFTDYSRLFSTQLYKK